MGASACPSYVFGAQEPKPLVGFEKYHCVRMVLRNESFAKVRVRTPDGARWFGVEERDGKWHRGPMLRAIEVMR